MTDGRLKNPATHPVLGAFLAAALVAAVRTLLGALRDGYLAGFPSEASDLALAGIAKHWIGALAPALVVALILAFARDALGRAHAPLIWAAATYLGFQFMRFGLPAEPFYTPGFGSARGLAVNAGTFGVALLAAWILSPRTRVPYLRVGLGATAALFLALFGMHVASVAPEPAAWPERPNVILISLDTLRADRLGCYGYGEDTTPELDRFAARSVRFTNALTPQPWTLTAHMSLLTSQHPLVHRVDQDRALPGSIPLLAEELRMAGYTTIAVVDLCPWMKPEYGFARGFDVYQRVRDDGDVKVDRVLNYLDDAGDRPLFLFAHFFGAHSDRRRLPYESAPEARAELTSWYDGEFTGCEPDVGCASLYLNEVNRRGETLDPERLRYISSLYDAGVRTLDTRLGRLFAELDARGLFDTSIVVVTADHGEEFQEYGMLLHEQLVTPCVHVPLMIRTPDVVGPRTHEGVVSLMDVAPTVLELAGLEPALPGGSSLAGIVRGDAAPVGPRYVLLDDGNRRFALRSRRHVVYYDEDLGFVAVDLEAPAGTAPVPILDGMPQAELRERLIAEAERLVELGDEHEPHVAPVAIPTAEVEGLRALGYTAGSEPGDG